LIALIATWLGIPLWIVLGIIGLKLWQRYQFKQLPDSFEAKIRVESGAVGGFKEKWPRISGYAVWVQTVLIVYEGLGLGKDTPLPVAALEGPVNTSLVDEAKRLGDNPVVFRLTLDDGATLLLAVPEEARTIAVGPFARTASGN
jgi:hypothetical protein